MKKRAPGNRTIDLPPNDKSRLKKRLIIDLSEFDIDNSRTICGDCQEIVPRLPLGIVDLMILDPPYNLNKDFNGRKFSRKSVDEYTAWLDERLKLFIPLLKKTATVYICGDWQSSPSVFTAASNHLIIHNRITWEREKGRGAKTNWKNSSEDIWFCTVSNNYTFNVDAVKLRRKVLAPYRNENGLPKDWIENGDGKFRDTAPSNIWADITIPFWSMPENTDHPTQKSEKLIAKLILASSNPGDIVFDPYLGSGTSSVVAKKLDRKYLGIEIDEDYCLLSEKRLEIAEAIPAIQGFSDNIFWERNTLSEQNK